MREFTPAWISRSFTGLFSRTRASCSWLLYWCRQLAPEVAFTLTSSTFTEMPAFDRNSIEQGSEDPSKDLGFGSEVARHKYVVRLWLYPVRDQCPSGRIRNIADRYFHARVFFQRADIRNDRLWPRNR